MDRKQFEEWFKTTDAYKLLEEMNYFKIDLFTFKEHRSQYQHTTVQIAYMTWQHQQAKVEELQVKLQMALDVVQCGKEVRALVIQERDELQKRVDAALKLIESWNEITFDKTTHWTEGYEEGCYHCAAELEQALKGEV